MIFYLPVAILVENFKCKSVLGVDDPNKKEAVSLNLVERHIKDLVIVQGVVGNGHTSGRVGRRELPWGIDGDDIKKSSVRVLFLSSRKKVPVKLSDINRKWNTPELLDICHLLNLSLIVSWVFLSHLFKLFFLLRVFFQKELLL